MSTPEHVHHAIDYIELYAVDLERARSFYEQAFGWEFNEYGPDYLGIRKAGGGEAGGLCRVPSVTPGGALVVLYSSDVEDTQERVRAAGGEITKALFDFPGGRRFQFRDPSGLELAVWSEPAR